MATTHEHVSNVNATYVGPRDRAHDESVALPGDTPSMPPDAPGRGATNTAKITTRENGAFCRRKASDRAVRAGVGTYTHAYPSRAR